MECTLDDWMENALTEPLSKLHSKPEPLSKLPRITASRFGVLFSKDDGFGNKVNTWPVVAAIEQGDTIAAEFPSIRTGCILKKINGDDAPATWEAAKLMLKARPLSLEFTSAVAEHTNQVTPWHHAALLEIGLVRRHEAMKLLTHRRVSPGCNDPHCSAPHCSVPKACQGRPNCLLSRTMSAGWLAISDPASSLVTGTNPGQLQPHLQPQPEPEPEPEQESRTKPSESESESEPQHGLQAAETQMTVRKGFVKKCVCQAAECAGHGAVALLRLHEARKRAHVEIEEGEP